MILYAATTCLYLTIELGVVERVGLASHWLPPKNGVRLTAGTTHSNHSTRDLVSSWSTNLLRHWSLCL